MREGGLAVGPKLVAILALLSFCSACLQYGGATAAEPGVDPLTANWGALKLRIEEKKLGSSFEEFRRSYMACRVIRELFSGPLESRAKLATPEAIAEIGERSVYVVEKALVHNLSMWKEPEPGTTGGERVLTRDPKAIVIAFRYTGVGLPSIEEASAGLLPGEVPGKPRNLLSDGPFEKFDISFQAEGNELSVAECHRDTKFSSEKFVLDWAQLTLHRLLGQFFSGYSGTLESGLPKGGYVPPPSRWLHGAFVEDDSLKLASGGKVLVGPWEAVVRVKVSPAREVGKIRDKGGNAVPRFGPIREELYPYGVPSERLFLRFRYDRSKDSVEIVSCQKDEAFARDLLAKQPIAAFVRKYLEATEQERTGMRADGATSQLPPEGKITFLPLPFFPGVGVRPVGENSWSVGGQIGHSTGFGYGKYRVAEFTCQVRGDKEGQLQIVKDSVSPHNPGIGPD